MSTATYFWHDFTARESGKAQEIASVIGLGPELDSDAAWKEIGRLGERDWRTIIEAWLGRPADFEQVSHALVREMPPVADARAGMKAIAVVAGLAAPLVAVCGLDDAALFARSLAKMVGQWGCETARGLLGAGPAGLGIANSQYSAQFAELVRQYNDDSYWRSLAKITQDQWVQILESAALEKSVGPNTGKIIQGVLTAYAFAAVGVLAEMVVLIVALFLAALLSIALAAIVIIAALIVMIVIAIATVGCVVASLLLPLGILGAKETPAGEETREQILALVRDGCLVPYPSATPA